MITPTLIQALPYLILLMAVLDITPTYYQFFLGKKKDAHTIYHEENIIPRMLIRWTGLKPISLLIHCTFQISFFIVFMTVLKIYISDYLIMYGMLLGMAVMVNYYHYFNIKFFSDHWNNETYWDRRKLEVAMINDLNNKGVDKNGE